MLKEYIGAVLPTIGKFNVKEELSSKDETSHSLLQHLNNLRDVQTLDRFFSGYMNDSKANLLDQVYFSELEKMEVRELHSFLS